jgi:glycosyltransferase involved in cell wall biosynthesis
LKIGIFSECYHPTINGVVVSIDTFREELEDRGHEYYIFAPKTKKYEDSNPRVFRYPSLAWPGQGYYPLGIPIRPSITKNIPNLKLDLIHTQHLFTMGWTGLKVGRKLKLPVVHTYHTLIAEYTHYAGFLSKIAKNRIIKWSAKYCNLCDKIITPSPSMKKVLEAYGVKTPIEPIPTGIYLDHFRPVDHRLIKSRFHIPDHFQTLLYVGRLSREKNVEFLLKSFKELLKTNPHTQLILVGGGPDEQLYRQMSLNLGLNKHLTFTGYLPKKETNKVFAGSDLFVFPSITDTQGIVIVEAMASGTVPIAINQLGPSDIIHSGQDGFLSHLGIKDFILKIKLLLDDPILRKKMAQKALQTAEQYSAQNTAKKLEKIYERLINQRNSRSNS